MVGELCLRWNNKDLVEELQWMEIQSETNPFAFVNVRRNFRSQPIAMRGLNSFLKNSCNFIADFLILSCYPSRRRNFGRDGPFIKYFKI